MIDQDFRVISEVRFQNFIVFEPHSIRVPDNDIMYSGLKVRDVFDEVMSKLARRDTIQDLIITNRLSKIANMLSLVQDDTGIVMTKFVDKIWKRYAYLSNLGENFLDLKTFLYVFPQYDECREDVIAQRTNPDDHDDAGDPIEEVAGIKNIEAVEV